MLFLFLSHTQIPVTCPMSDLSPVACTSGAAPYQKMSPGTDLILAEVFPKAICI